MPKVSVIIPVCNVEAYLRQCLDSVLNPTMGAGKAFTEEVMAASQSFAAVDQLLVGYRVNKSASLQATNTQTPLCFYDALLEARRRFDGMHRKAMRRLASETIEYLLHSVRTVSGFLLKRAEADFGARPPVSRLKGSSAFSFKIFRALETLRERGLVLCFRRVMGSVSRI